MRITVFLVAPPAAPGFANVDNDYLAFRRLLGTETLATYIFRAGGRVYQLWCDDLGVEKDLPPTGQLIGERFPGWVMRGPFLITRVRGDEDTSVVEDDMRHIRTFVNF